MTSHQLRRHATYPAVELRTTTSSTHSSSYVETSAEVEDHRVTFAFPIDPAGYVADPLGEYGAGWGTGE
jgi:hypothetical protein